jgi:micrococcal nuclease
MFKRFAYGVLLLVLGLSLIGCEEEARSDYDILYDIRESIEFDETTIEDDITIPDISNEDVIIKWESSNPNFLTNTGEVTIPTYIEGDKTITLLLTLQLNDTVMTKSYTFTVVSEERPEQIDLNTDETDALEMNFDYESYDFLPDGVGEVTLVRCVDGDTAIFAEGSEQFSARFLGINTPESTAKFEPWGKAASDFTCDKLTNAETIVLQADPASGRLDSYGERYLSWVWYDGRLLNLELVELAYSKSSGGTDTLYGQLIAEVNLAVQYTERRVWGETDPNYDYSLEGVQISIEELVTNPSEYYSRKVAISGLVTATAGYSAFIQQGDYGIYVYNRSWAPDLTVGNEVQLSGVTVTYYPDEATGALQVSGYSPRDPYSEVVSRENEVIPTVLTIESIDVLDIGRYVQLNDLTVVGITLGTEGAFTLNVEDEFGLSIDIRVDSDAPSSVVSSLFTVSDVVDITGPISRYQSRYQIMLTKLEHIEIK